MATLPSSALEPSRRPLQWSLCHQSVPPYVTCAQALFPGAKCLLKQEVLSTCGQQVETQTLHSRPLLLGLLQLPACQHCSVPPPAPGPLQASPQPSESPLLQGAFSSSRTWPRGDPCRADPICPRPPHQGKGVRVAPATNSTCDSPGGSCVNTVGRISLSPPDPSGFLSPESAGPDPVASSAPQAVSKASQTAELPLQTGP